MEFIHAKNPNKGIGSMAKQIASALNSDRKVLWLICGGSNIPLAVRAMNEIRSLVPEDKLQRLTVGQTDERYGQVGHKDSNWAQLMELGLAVYDVTTIPILVDKSLESTVSDYSIRLGPVIEEVKSSNGLIVAQFGIGTNGHVAGIEPDSVSINDKSFVSGYNAGTYIRITINPIIFGMIDVAYCFAFGEGKKIPVHELRDKNLPISKQPAQLLKQIKESYLYSDEL